MDDRDACSRLWDSADLPAWGTAVVGGFYVAVEQPGAWGAKAWRESELDPELGVAIEARVKELGGKAFLIRHVGRSQLHDGRRTVLVAGPDWLVRTSVADAAELLTLPLADGPEALRAHGFEPADPVLLVCTNGRRDVCCARYGRSVSVPVAAQRPGAVWEASHLGGHRFAPTAVVLPSLQLLARLTPELAVEAIDAARRGELAAGILGPRHDRGFGWLAQPQQAAVAAVHAQLRDVEPLSLEVVAADGDAMTVAHRDGRRFAVAVTRRAVGPCRVSCGKEPVEQAVWDVTVVQS